jgi:hypothetical protein
MVPMMLPIEKELLIIFVSWGLSDGDSGYS